MDADAANLIARGVLASGVDTALSEKMVLDHGFAQALQLLVGSITARPTVPIFINCVGEPLGPVRRIRLLGTAVGRAVATLNKRVLLVDPVGCPTIRPSRDSTPRQPKSGLGSSTVATPHRPSARRGNSA